MKLYSIYNENTERFNPPFVARDDDDAIATVRNAIIGGRDISLLVELGALTLHRVGEFDAETSVLRNDDECIIRLDEVKLPEHIQVMIDKLLAIESNVQESGVKSWFGKLLEKMKGVKENDQFADAVQENVV